MRAFESGESMANVLRVLAVLFVLSLPLAAQEMAVPLRNPRAAVATTYAQLSTQRLMDRKVLYASLPASMQSDLWALHLSYFLEEQQDLTAPERSLIFEAIGLIETGLLELPRSSPESASSAAEFDRHVRQLGSRRVFDALTQLGGPELHFTVKAHGLRTEWEPGDDCECSTDSDYCCFGDCPTSTTPNCHRSGRPWCIAVHGCGLFWSFDCDGICGA